MEHSAQHVQTHNVGIRKPGCLFDSVQSSDRIKKIAAHDSSDHLEVWVPTQGAYSKVVMIGSFMVDQLEMPCVRLRNFDIQLSNLITKPELLAKPLFSCCDSRGSTFEDQLDKNRFKPCKNVKESFSAVQDFSEE